MKRISVIAILICLCFVNLLHPINVKADTQEYVAELSIPVSDYGKMNMSFLYSKDTSSGKKTFIKWTYFRAYPNNGKTVYYISREALQSGNDIKIIIKTQGYNYNTYVTSPVYTYTRII